MNTHVPPPAEDEAKSRRPRASGEAALKERPERAPAETKEPKPSEPEQRQAGKPGPGDPGQAAAAPADEKVRSPAYGFWARRGFAGTAVAIAVVVGLLLWRPWTSHEPKITYTIAKATYGTVTVRVGSTAVLEPRNSVEVTAQTGGRLERLLVKSGDEVAKGQILAQLVSDSAQEDVIAAETEFAARGSNVARSEADVAEARAAVLRARADAKPGAVDTAQARLARASANLAEARALLGAGQENLMAARANVQNLAVRAPIDGIVLKTDANAPQNARAVARGQSLVTLAAGLTQMKLSADFPESALGRLHVGDRATFTVPAFPGRSFAATLSVLDVWPRRESRDGRIAVTYGGELTAENPAKLLRPGMTATVAVVVAEAKNVLIVPNAALSFVPAPKIEAAFAPPKAAAGTRPGRVWVLRSDSLEPRDVSLGLSDGRVTQIAGGPLRADETVVTGSLIAAAGT
jgi:HlyD family secretion protein